MLTKTLRAKVIDHSNPYITVSYSLRVFVLRDMYTGMNIILYFPNHLPQMRNQIQNINIHGLSSNFIGLHVCFYTSIYASHRHDESRYVLDWH